MIVKILNIIAVLMLAISGLAVLFPWRDVLVGFQLRNNQSSRDGLFRYIEKEENRLNTILKRKPIIGNDWLTGKVYGTMFSQEKSARALDTAHQAFRKSFGLEEFSIQSREGVLDRERVSNSFGEIEQKIIYQANYYESKDLRYLSLCMLVGGTGLAVIANIL